MAALEAVRAIERVHGDGNLPTIPVHETNDPDYYGEFAWDSTGKADRINLSTHGKDAWPALTMAHEAGHFLDHSGLSGGSSANAFESATESTAEMRGVMHAIRASGTYALLETPPRTFGTRGNCGRGHTRSTPPGRAGLRASRASWTGF